MTALARLLSPPIILTSLMKSRLDRQRVCVKSWQRLGVVFSLGPEETNREVKEEFPEVEFFPLGNNERGMKKHLALINSFFDFARGKDRWFVLTNSDIELGEDGGEFLERFLNQGSFSYFRRRNYDLDKGRDSYSVFAWGMDTFLFHGLDVPELNRTSLSIGMPFWDYWIPFEFMNRGFILQTANDAPLWHENHEGRWDETDWYRTAKEFFSVMLPIAPWKFSEVAEEIHQKIKSSTMVL